MLSSDCVSFELKTGGYAKFKERIFEDFVKWGVKKDFIEKKKI